MSKERLIELAKQAGWEYAHDDRGFEPLWAFAELVRADEREACAQVVWEMKGQCWAYDHDTIATAIRARSNT